jgi:polyhydroxyalkanoate synthesis regulator phasin
MTTKKTEKAYEKVLGAFDPRATGEDVLKSMRASIDTTFENAAKIQDMNVKMLKDSVEMGKKIQEDAAQMVDDFIEGSKKGRDEYRKVIEEGFQKAEEMFLQR